MKKKILKLLYNQHICRYSFTTVAEGNRKLDLNTASITANTIFHAIISSLVIKWSEEVTVYFGLWMLRSGFE